MAWISGSAWRRAPGSFGLSSQVSVLALALALLFLGATAREATATPPNILFILADDLGSNDLPSFALSANDGATHAATPTLDRLARQGIRFTRFYSDSSCAATRAGLLTGRAPASLGFRPAGAGIAAEISTLPEQLRQAGYQTHHVGKWHLGYEDQAAWPLQQGYDHFFGFLNQFLLNVPAASSGWGRPTYRNPYLQRDNEARQRYQGHLSDLLLAEGQRTLTALAASDRPWFLSFWPYLPHEPMQPPREIASRFPATDEGRYLAMLAALDAQVAGLMETLENTGLLENTVLIFASDNGGTARRFPSNAPLRGQKGFFYEGGLRVPLFLWHSAMETGQRIERVVSYLDVAPTILAIAGAEATGMVGRDMRLRSSGPSRQHFWTAGFDPVSWSALGADGDWRVVVDALSPGGMIYATDPAAAERSAPVGLDQTLSSAFERWAARQRAVLVQRHSSGHRGRSLLTGNRFLRAPGAGAHSIALCLTDLGPKDPAPATMTPQVLLEQGNLWRVVIRGGELIWWAQGVEVRAALPAATRGRLLLVSHFDRALAYPDRRRALLKVYFDDALLATQEATEFPLRRVDLHIPTVVGSGSDGAAPFAGTIGAIGLWNDLPSDRVLVDDWVSWSNGFSCGER